MRAAMLTHEGDGEGDYGPPNRSGAQCSKRDARNYREHGLRPNAPFASPRLTEAVERKNDTFSKWPFFMAHNFRLEVGADQDRYT